ncbi:MAG TPA: acyltransferase [Actinomycetota bacterium]|nr:acyltransferase [Actinomycetota bacterium]
MERGSRNRALDGVRAIAIAMVVVFHSLRHVSGGYIGVEIFFTLSGFLITTLLLGEIASRGSIDKGAFYARRALRLLPALFGAIALCVVLVAVTGGNHGGLPLTRAVPAVVLYVGNWVEAAGVSLGFLSHTWSLAIEEQFYLVWPFVVVALARRRDALPLLVKVTIGLVLARAFLTPFAPSTLNFSVWTTSRADCLLIGAILAIAVTREPERVVRAADRPWIGAAALLTLAGVFALLSFVRSPEMWSDYGMTTVVAVATAALLAHVIALPEGAIARALAWRPAAAVGRVSYGIYLYHWPIVAALSATSLAFLPRIGLEYALTALAVVVSWFVIERPALRAKRRFVRTRVEVAGEGEDAPVSSLS